MRHPSPTARSMTNNPAPTTTAPMAGATRAPDGARRSMVMAAVTTAMARRSMTRVALPSARMSTKEVFKALERYTAESRERDRQTEMKLGVNRITLTAPASNGLMRKHAFFEYRAKPMSTPHIEEHVQPINYLIKMELGAALHRSQELLQQEARHLAPY